MAAFLRHCEQQRKFADAEMQRITRRKDFIARVQKELEQCVVGVIQHDGRRSTSDAALASASG